MDKELSQFKKDGFLIVKNAFSADEMEVISTELDGLLNNVKSIPTVQYRNAPWNPELPERIDPVSPYSPVFSSINQDQRITRRMQKFFPQHACHYFRDKLIFKAPSQAGYGPHQDQSWWNIYGATTITCFLAIDPANADNGGLQLLRGSHRSLLTNPAEPRYLTTTDLQLFDESAWYMPELNSGDIVFFHGQTVHRSNSNQSGNWRRTYFTSYCC